MMKVVALLLCGLAVAAANEHWENFKIKHGKSYANLEDESYRKSVYENNQKTIDAHNERFRQGLVTFDMAMNQFGDMTQEEIVATMHGLSKEVNHPRRQRVAAHKTSSKPLANAVDWRDEGAVTHVKDQGACGSCWAFSATGALEGQHFLSAGKLVSLSEQNLVDCSTAYGNEGCNGGWPYWAYQYISDNKGIDTEHSYPYEAIDNVCRYDSSSIGATCTGYVDIKKGDEGDLQDAVQNIGPISVCIDASQTSFSFYSSGVYYEPSCSSHLLDHAVLTVGYGVEGTDEYWLVKNSWAKSWGDQGYIKMARNRHNNCGIATAAVYPSV